MYALCFLTLFLFDVGGSPVFRSPRSHPEPQSGNIQNYILYAVVREVFTNKTT